MIARNSYYDNTATDVPTDNMNGSFVSYTMTCVSTNYEQIYNSILLLEQLEYAKSFHFGIREFHNNKFYVIPQSLRIKRQRPNHKRLNDNSGLFWHVN